ncbi:MAG: type II toxin-antitoxin system VapC family toxin [Actinomycetota bacterium]|nr:type II toxin-antitoxin system VapC family toxin [Actinomycetota bacterium]
MTTVYFDSSAFVKLLLPESGRDVALDLWERAECAVSSRLASPEVFAALAAAARGGRAVREAASRLGDVWSIDIWAQVWPVALTERVERLAAACAQQFQLSGADAVHLASALVLDDSSVVMATWDRRLSDAARAAGLRVVPANP